MSEPPLNEAVSTDAGFDPLCDISHNGVTAAADARGILWVARHNAWPLLYSLTRWLRTAGRSGLVLDLDLGRLVVARRPPVGLRDGHYYSKAAILDAYEVLRQLIDATDELEGLFVAAQVLLLTPWA